MRKPLLVMGLLALAGCPSDPRGRECAVPANPCGDGYSCIEFARSSLTGGDLVRVCQQACERSSDCPGGGCFAYSSVRQPRACLGTGTAGVGDRCRSPEDCGPGLRCVAQFRYVDEGLRGTCLPGCELYSPHGVDRACASGSACLSYGVRDGSSDSFCAPGCDVSAQSGCEDGEVCVWMEVPGQPNAPMCWPATALSRCSTVIRDCNDGEVCGRDAECYAPQDAPPYLVLGVEAPVD